jgi:hypothetical protein
VYSVGSILRFYDIFSGQHYMRVGYNDADPIHKRAAVVVAWLAAGRSSEVGYSNFKNSFWDYDEQYIYFDWNEKKQARQKPMTFVSDAECYEIDFYHCLACHYILSGMYTLDVL